MSHVQIETPPISTHRAATQLPLKEDVVVKVDDVHKRFAAHSNRVLTLKEQALRMIRGRNTLLASSNWIEVLRGVSFSVRESESVSLLGKNGGGKSTLLRIIAGIYEPTSGSVSVTGRMSPLIELGAGFQGEFTGRENAKLYAQILGLTLAEIEDRMPRVIEFSELGDFMDRPVRMYSTGMVSRLAFSVATEIQPQILLLDEVLSVGDHAFQKKCFARIDEIKSKGTTIIMVTHSTGNALRWSERSLYLRNGRIVADGPSEEVTKQYLADS